MNILNKNVAALASSVSVTVDEVRLAAYAGTIYGFIEFKREEFDGLTEADVKMKVYELFYNLNEVAVLDRNSFLDVSNKMVKFLKNPMQVDSVVNSFEDALGIGSVFGLAAVGIINKNIETFRNTRKLIKDVLKTNNF